jgi:hypothetical protein
MLLSHTRRRLPRLFGPLDEHDLLGSQGQLGLSVQS